MKLFLAGTAALAAISYSSAPCLLSAFDGDAGCESAGPTTCSVSAPTCGSSDDADVALSGDYVEGRTASVYAGACHYGGEYTIAGREAVLAWSISAGRIGGVELAGTSLVAIVSGDQNLAEADVQKRSVVFLPEGVSEAQREALLGWLDPELVGEVTNLVLTDVSCVRADEVFSVRAGEAVALEGSLLPNRECCAMPFNVWYSPFVELENALVGCTESFACENDELDLHFSSNGENCVFTGQFSDAGTN